MSGSPCRLCVFCPHVLLAYERAAVSLLLISLLNVFHFIFFLCVSEDKRHELVFILLCCLTASSRHLWTEVNSSTFPRGVRTYFRDIPEIEPPTGSYVTAGWVFSYKWQIFGNEIGNNQRNGNDACCCCCCC